MAEKIEYIEAVDKLNTGRKKINDFAIKPALNAEKNSNTAINIANSANSKSQMAIDSAENVQNQLNTVVIEGDSSVEAAQARVAEDGTVYPTLKDRLDERANKYLFESAGEFEGVEDVFVPKLSEIVSKIDDTKFNVGMMTDNHYDYGGKISRAWSNKMLRHLANINAISSKLNLIVHGGDNGNSGVTWSIDPTLQTMRKMYSQYVTKAIEADCDVLFAIGNHDDGSIVKGTLGVNPTLNQILTEQDFKNLTYTKDLIAGENRENDSLYCFKDYPDRKIRVIILNAADTPEDATNTDGTQKYLRQWTLGYRQQQLDWLINTALVVPEDYHTMIFSHVNLTEIPTEYANASEMHYNHNVLENIMRAFISGSSYVAEQPYPDAPEYSTSISADFSAQGPRIFVGYFNGHTHRERIDDHTVFKAVHCLASVTPSEDLMYTDTEDGWTVISVDTANRHVDLFGFGRATDRSIDY